MEFIGTLCLILVTTTLGTHFSRRIGIPAVIGQLLIGVILGSAGLNWIHSNELVHEFSEIGVILLMFIAGLESWLSALIMCTPLSVQCNPPREATCQVDEYCERIEPPVRKNEPVNADNSATECGQGNHINNLANNRDLL
ncbi:cation:proton antiporter domain-containing protein, partial [Enterococcus olivae]